MEEPGSRARRRVSRGEGFQAAPVGTCYIHRKVELWLDNLKVELWLDNLKLELWLKIAAFLVISKEFFLWGSGSWYFGTEDSV